MFLSGIGSGATVGDLPRLVGLVHALKSPGPLALRPRYQGRRGGAADRGSRSRAPNGAASAPPEPAPGRPQ